MEKQIDVVITMGGLGSRFREKGYRVPKYMIGAKGRTLFEWSMMSLEGYRDKVSQYIFIALKDDAVDVEAFIRQQCEKMELPKYHIMLL
ncbi:hypothetical protein AALA98_04140 [Lachnospiraceae bacterium 45-W7]